MAEPENKKPDKPLISRQITVYKTSKKLIEFNDKLKASTPYEYAHIHANHKYNGHKLVSCIGVKILNYSEKLRKTAECNLDPNSILELYEYARICKFSKGRFGTFLDETKIIAAMKDDKGLSPVTKMKVFRQEKSKDGETYTNPWFIMIENGTGRAAKGANGGSYCQKNTYTKKESQFIQMTDDDFYKHINKVCRFLNAWEVIQLSTNLRAMKKLLYEQKRAKELEEEQAEYEECVNGEYDSSDN